MRIGRATVGLVLLGLLGACAGGGDSADRTRNAALEVKSASLPFPATNVWPWDIRWSPEAQRAVSYSGDAAFEGLFVGQASVVKTSDPDDESVPASFPVSQYGAKTATPDGNGGWYLGGSYLYIDGQNRGKLAHVLADGTLDNAFFLDITPDESVGFDNSAVNWVAMHPNGTDVLVAVSGATSVGGAEVENRCNDIYVLDGATGARKVGSEPSGGSGCVTAQVVVGNRLIRNGGYGSEATLLQSIDLTTGRPDGFLDTLNSRYPYFSDAAWDYRYLAEIEVRGDTLWVSGNLDSAGHRVAKFDLVTGTPVDFAAPPVLSTSWEPQYFDFAATDTHVLVHVRERDDSGAYVSAFHMFDAETGTRRPFDPGIPAVSWTWPVGDVTVWKDNFLLTGAFGTAAGRRVRGHVTLDAAARVAPSQLPYAVTTTYFDSIEVTEFPAEDRTFVNFRGTNALFDPFLTGAVLVTDKDGVPQEFRMDAETESRELGGVGVVGKWLYVSTLAPYEEGQPMWADSRVDRFDLVTGKRDEGFRVDTGGKYVYDIYGNDDHLAFLLMDAARDVNTVSLRLAVNGDENTSVDLVAEGEVMYPGEAMVSDGNLFVRVVPQQGVSAPVAARIELSTGQTTYVSGASSPDLVWTRPSLTSKGLMVPMRDQVLVVDPGSMKATASIGIDFPVDVAEIDGRIVVNATGIAEVDPGTLLVKGPWGPQDFSVTRIVPTGDGALGGIAQPWRRTQDTVVSGLFGLGSDGTVVTLGNYVRTGKRPAADSPEVGQVAGPPVLALPVPEPLPGAAPVLPPVPAPNATTQREVGRVSILDVLPGDRSVTVVFRPAAGAGQHTVRTVGGKQSCTTGTGECTVRGLTAGTQYRFVVVPDGDAVVSGESAPVSPWVAVKRGSARKLTALLKVPAKGTVKWKVTGAACAIKGSTLTARKKGMCTLAVTVRSKTGTVRSVTNVRVI